MSASDRLERLLYVLPRAAQRGGARIDDLCRALDVKRDTILADIEEATERVFYHPGGMVDPFELTVDDDVVKLYGSDFNRPLRLTAPEAMALGLGLRVLAAESDAERREHVLALAHRMEAEMVTPEIELQPMLADHRLREAFTQPPEVQAEVAPYGVAFGEDDFRGAIAEAIEAHLLCDVVYLKPGAGPAERRLAPVRLMYTRGHWYMRAVEPESQQHRTYRLDRILNLRATNEQHAFEDLPVDSPTFTTGNGDAVQVRYSPAVARWVAEREDTQIEADGSVSLTHNVVDMSWLVRHVLQYGGEAVVEDAGEAREVVALAASQVLRAD